MCRVLVVFALPLASLVGAQTRSEDVGQPPDTTIAVAPFLNLSRQPEDDWIGVGIAETVSNDLGNLGWSVGAQPVLVEALDQASQADGLWQPVEAVLERCRELGIAWLVSGAYQRVGDRLRITTRIIDVHTGRVVHSAKVDGSLGDLFATQDQIATAVVEGFQSARPTRSAASTGAPPSGMPPPAPTVDLVGANLGGDAIGTRPRAVAFRTSRPPVIDGRLDDPVWQEVRPITGFVQTSRGSPRHRGDRSLAGVRQ